MNYGLGLSLINDFTYNSMNDSMKKFYNVNGDISLFNPYITLFTNYEKNHHFNNKHKLLKLIKKKRRIDTTGFVYKGLIKYKNITYFKNVFIKEIPLYPIDLLHLKDVDLNNISYTNQLINRTLYNFESCCHIEIFVSYLVNKLSELKMSPSFCCYYGSYLSNFKKYTYVVETGNYDHLQNCKFIVKNEDLYIEAYNLPVYTLATEELEFDFKFAYQTKMINYFFFISIIFQVISAVIVMNKEFNIKHNDLHIGNIMFTKTERKYLYYRCEHKFFMVPTFGYLVKIIDWGRCTYDYNSIKCFNSVFKFNGECHNQYREDKLGSKKQNILPSDNRWSDLVIFSHNLLFNCPEYIDSPIGIFLKKIIKAKDGALDIDSFSWDTYLNISNNTFNVKPKILLKNNIFKEYLVKKNDIDNQVIYDLNY